MIKRIWLKNFRNIAEVSLDLSCFHHLYVFGNNNQGKTNFLESLYYLANGTMPRFFQKDNVLPFHESVGYMGVDFVDKMGQDNRLYLKLSSLGGRHLSLNDETIKGRSTIQTLFPVAYLSSEIIDLSYGAPSMRRKILDQLLCQISPNYSDLLKKYQQCLKQKNAILKLGATPASLSPWNTQFILLSEAIVKYRQSGVAEWERQSQSVVETCSDLSDDTLSFLYCLNGKVPLTAGTDYKDWLESKLAYNMSAEIAAKKALYGPHLDDIQFLVTQKCLKTFFSKGMNRLYTILFKIAILEILDKKCNNFPLLLIDDAFSEVDETFKTYLFDYLKDKVQVFYATTTDMDAMYFKSSVKIMEMVSGELIGTACDHVEVV